MRRNPLNSVVFWLLVDAAAVFLAARFVQQRRIRAARIARWKTLQADTAGKTALLDQLAEALNKGKGRKGDEA